jgi:heptosyltransferase-3
MDLKRNVLIFHLGALGDFVITWPIALTMARLFPQSRIFYVTHSQKGALAEKALRIESIDIEAGWHQLFSDDPELPAASARALAGAHTIISFLANGNDKWTANVRRANPQANLISLTTSAPDDFAGHITDFLIEQLATWPAAQTAARQILRSVNDRGILSLRNPNGPFLIHPGSGAARKNWPPERFLQLVEQLRGAGRSVKVLLGDVELEQWPADLVGRFKAAAGVATRGSLVELFAQISSGSAFIGNDSGPSHLAGILGIPTICLFGPTSKLARWKPLGPRVNVMSASLEELNVMSVDQALRTIPSFGTPGKS